MIRRERVKNARPCCDGGLRLATKPPQVIPKGLLSEAALAWVISSKYLDRPPSEGACAEDRAGMLIREAVGPLAQR